MRLVALAKNSPVVYAVLKRGWTTWGSVVPPKRVPGIPGRIHHNDLMFEGPDDDSIRGYSSTGSQAIGLIERALQVSGKSFDDVSRALDFGCGYGRVLRYLVQRIDPDQITVCDLDRRAAGFCVKEFGAKAIPGSTDLDRIPFESYDLIWMGSVLTHVDLDVAEALLRALSSVLAPQGSLIFTTLGPSTVDEIDGIRRVSRDKKENALNQLRDSGFSYLPYEHYRGGGYGMAWYTPERLRSTVDRATGGRLRLGYDERRGWADLQDVWGFSLPA